LSQSLNHGKKAGNLLGAYEQETVKHTLDPAYVPDAILEARAAQDRHLEERFQNQPLAIADIGSGDGYHGATFAPGCTSYHAFEISHEMGEVSRKRWAAMGLTNTRLFVGDAAEAPLEPSGYDLVWSLYFTPGNFRDPCDDLSVYTNAYLDDNPNFQRIVSRFYAALKPAGHMFLTVYRDVPAAEQAQREFYRRTGQTLLTPPGSRFVATAENFWSVRWTKQSMQANLGACGIDPGSVIFHELNAISWLVEILK